MQSNNHNQEINYRVNDKDEIVFVNAAWDAFASGNSGMHLTASSVVGRSLWSFIVDSTTRALYRDLLTRARSGRPVRFPFRCDAPNCRRHLEMNISPMADGLTDFRVRTLSEEPRPPQRLLDPAQSRSSELLRMCGWCKKVNAGGIWVEVEDAVTRLNLFDQTILPDVTHGVCEGCYARLIAALDEDEGLASSKPAP